LTNVPNYQGPVKEATVKIRSEVSPVNVQKVTCSTIPVLNVKMTTNVLMVKTTHVVRENALTKLELTTVSVQTDMFSVKMARQRVEIWLFG